MLIFDNVHFYYKKGQPLIENMCFTIEAGEYVTIVGANGCGKSTLAKLMNGLLLPKEGRVRWNSRDTSTSADLAVIREQIGLVFQNPEDQFITTTVMDELLFGLENIRLPREEMDVRVNQALQAVQMQDYIKATPHKLSGGQKQRVAIAAVLAMKPHVMIFDEATSMLDPQGRKQVLGILQELHRMGMTVIHITHHMEEVLDSERVLLIHEGQLAYDGDPLALFESVSVADYRLKLPFAVRLQQLLRPDQPLQADWKEMIRARWATN